MHLDECAQATCNIHLTHSCHTSLGGPRSTPSDRTAFCFLHTLISACFQLVIHPRGYINNTLLHRSMIAYHTHTLSIKDTNTPNKQRQYKLVTFIANPRNL